MKDWSELPDQTRAIIAAALALVVILGWGLLYKPPPPTPGQLSQSTTTQSSGAPVASPTAPQIVAAPPSGGPAAATVPPVSTNAEQTVTIESDLYRVVLSNRGAVARSWQLTKYTDEHDPPRTLDLIQSDASQAAGGWPFSLQMNDPQLESAANQGLYVVTQSGAALSGPTLSAPVEVEFRWSDGQLEVTKRWKFDRSYTVELETSVRRNGQPLAHRVAWRGGFGDVTAYRAPIQTLAFSGSAGNMSTLAIKKLGAPGQPTVPADQPGSFDAVGIEDLYFAAAFLPPAAPAGQPVPADLTLSAWQLIRNVQADGKTTQVILPEMAAGLTTSGPQAFRVFVGPKDLDTLKAVRPPLNGLVQFGWFGFIAEPLFYSLRWLHHYIPNYGWAIVIMTLAINMVLYPLKVKSWRSMQRMQKVAPEIRQIQDRYKKYSMRDPRKQEMNKEVMAVYSREGINPMGSCLPTVIQMPIWFGLYRMLTVTLELRHAPWIGWIHDLSGRDPYYVLPVVMAVLMYAVTKMTPQTITDPSQARMMALMPVMFGGMFIVFPVSSGLVLYILTSNFVAMVQQWHLNRTSPLKPPKAKKRQRAALGRRRPLRVGLEKAGIMSAIVSQDGKLDHDGAGDELRRFLDATIAAARFDLRYRVERPEPAAGEELETPEIIVFFDGPDRDLLLDRGAELLKALEYIAVRWLRLNPQFHDRVRFDCGNYRANRMAELKLSAEVAAQRVSETRLPFRFNPMTPRERRIIHLVLKDQSGVRTSSEGLGDDRRVVLFPSPSETT